MHDSLQKRAFQLLGWTVKLTVGLVICFSLLMFSFEVPSMAQSMNSSPINQDLSQVNKEIALRLAKEGWGTQPNWQQVWDELMAPNIIYHFNSLPDKVVGLEANKQFNQDLFIGFPKLKNTIENVVAEDDVVIYRSTLEGKQSGPFLGMPATNKTVRVNDFTMLKIKDGKISEWWYETNLLSVMQQLGLIPDA